MRPARGDRAVCARRARRDSVAAGPGEGVGLSTWVFRVRSQIRVLVACAIVLGVALYGVASLEVGGSARAGHRAGLAAKRGFGGLPLGVRGPVAAALGGGDRRYWVRGSRAANRAQNLALGFSRTGVSVRSGRAVLGFSLVSFGRSGVMSRLGTVAPVARANRVVYGRAGVLEWYANGPLGLEQGFDVARRPAGGAGRMVFAISLSGGLRAEARGDGVVFSGSGASLRYTGVSATDSRGRPLPARVGLSGGRLVVSVDDRGARYPVRVDPFVQQAELTPSEGHLDGASVAMSGDTIVASGYNDEQGPARSVVYVFVKPANGWANATQTAELTGSDGGFQGCCGAVAISGDTIVAGAQYPGAGAVYVFVKPVGGWVNATQTAKLTASDGADGAALGNSVAISGDTIVAGADAQQFGANNFVGAVYVFVEPAGG